MPAAKSGLTLCGRWTILPFVLCTSDSCAIFFF